MSQVQIRCACGHTVTAFVDYREDFATSNLGPLYQGGYVCPQCANATLPQSSPHAQGNNLHLMQGSAFQVAWALGIRSEHLQRFERLTEHLPEGTKATMRAEMKRLTNAQTEARWWIEHQHNTFHPFISVCSSAIRSLVIRAAYKQTDLEPFRKRRPDSL